MDDNRWMAYAMEHNLPLPNFQNSASSSKSEDKFTFKTRGMPEPLTAIKDQKLDSGSTGAASGTIEEHPENWAIFMPLGITRDTNQ